MLPDMTKSDPIRTDLRFKNLRCHAQLSFGIALLSFLICGTGTAPAQNYIPETTTLVNRSGEQVCAIGSSKSNSTVPAYYLTKGDAEHGVWREVTTSTASVAALELGKDISEIRTSPSVTQPYLNSAVIRFFVIARSAGVDCSSITFKFVPGTATGDLEVSYYPYPQALFEMTAWPSGPSSVLTMDTSNVDSFQVPLMMEVRNGSTTLAELGNPTAPAVATRTTMVTGPHDQGGAESPFVAWLKGQSGDSPKLFEPLALSSASTGREPYPFAMLQSPKDYLSAKCLQGGSNTTVPANCQPLNSTLHALNPLNEFFDTALKTFFENAYASPGTPLSVMGDAAGSIGQAAWTATSNTANCPIYMIPDGKSLLLTQGSNQIVICNPVGQVVPLAGPLPGYVSTGALTGQITISQQQYDRYKDKVGWNIGQPDTGFGGTVTGIESQSGSYYIAITLPSAISAQQPNVSFNWAFSNLQNISGLNMYESAGEMVFANDGAFSAWSPQYIKSNADLSTVALSIERNIVAAFSRGIANCNNVTMTGKAPPAYCANVVKSAAVVPAAANASDAYWSDEANWYPANSPHDYYAQYIHTARLDDKGKVVTGGSCPDHCFNMFFVPNNSISSPASSNQGIPMGMGYGFAYDENPTYTQSSPAQVPSKLDPIPTSWGTGLSLAVTIGRSRE